MGLTLPLPADETESQLFRAEVKETAPLRQETPVPWQRRPPPLPLVQPLALQEDESEGSIVLSEAEVETHEYLFFARPGIQKRVLADLQRGAIPRGLELDLHGLTAVFAEQLCRDFLDDCARRHIRCAQIIHGKGYGSQQQQPVLKRKVNYWLRLRPDVLAFCSATRRDGGTGSVYVLLRNPKKSRPSAGQHG